MHRYAVSLFFRRTDEFATSKTVKERLTTKIVYAINEQEAFGKAYDSVQDRFKEFDMVYKLVVLIDESAPSFTLEDMKDAIGQGAVIGDLLREAFPENNPQSAKIRGEEYIKSRNRYFLTKYNITL